jgi:methylated-DNA-[protein]-cysteine S-methyltransferase
MYTRHATLHTVEIDDVTLVATDAAVTGIYYPQHWTKPDWTTFGEPVELTDDVLLNEAATQVQEYLCGRRTTFDFPTAVQGNVFEQRVWAILNDVGFGQTITYGEIAEQLGDRRLARMVGRAVGHNPLSIVVGCHRVVGSNGKLTGYAGGLPRKEFLLNLEEPARVKAGRLF